MCHRPERVLKQFLEWGKKVLNSYMNSVLSIERFGISLNIRNVQRFGILTFELLFSECDSLTRKISGFSDMFWEKIFNIVRDPG